jgi:hypothetical protein
MFDNLYFFASEPREFFWNDVVYTSIDEWRADTGLDSDSQFVGSDVRAQFSGALEALKSEPILRPDMFQELHRLANQLD